MKKLTCKTMAVVFLFTVLLISGVYISQAPRDKNIASNTVTPAVAESVVLDSLEFLSEQDPFARIAIESSNELSQQNISDYVEIIDPNKINLRVNYSNGEILPPINGYLPGFSYVIKLKDDVHFVDSRIKDRTEIILNIKKEEIFESKYKKSVIELPDSSVFSYNKNILTVMKDNYMTGQIIVFNNYNNLFQEPTAVKIVSVISSDNASILETEQPALEEVFEKLDVSYKYKLGADNLEIYEENVEKAIKEDPFFSSFFEKDDLALDVPQIKVDTTFKDGELKVDVSLRVRLKQFSEKTFKVLPVKESINLYLIFKMTYTKNIEVTQNIDTSTGNYSVISKIVSTVRTGVFLEVDGVVIKGSGDSDKKPYEKFSGLNGLDKSIFKSIEEALGEIGKNNSTVGKEKLIAKFYATYMGIVGVGVDIKLILGVNFTGSLGAEYVYKETLVYGHLKTANNDEGESLENKTVTTEDGFNFYLRGTFEAKFGIKVEAYVDLLFIFKAGVSVEAGLYAKGGGAIQYASGITENIESDSEIDVNEYGSKWYKAAYFSIGFYAEASFFIKANFIFIKPSFTYKFASVKIPFVELGSEECVHINIANMPKDNTIALSLQENSKIPEIRVKKINLFTGVYSNDLAKKDELIIDFDKSKLYIDAENIIRPVNPVEYGEYEITISLLNKRFKNHGVGVDASFFGLKGSTRKEEDYVADLVKLKVVNRPNDISSFEVKNYEGLNQLPLGGSITLYPDNILPFDASFFDVTYSIINSINGISINENGVLSADKDAPLGANITVRVSTVRNQEKQVSVDYTIQTAPANINSVDILLIDKLTGEHFDHYNRIPQGASIELVKRINPEYANKNEVSFTIKSGHQYISSFNDDIILISNNIPNNSEIHIAAIYKSQEMDQITLIIDNTLLNTLEIVAPTDVYRNDIINLSVLYTPENVNIDNGIHYTIRNGLHLAKIDNNKLIINSDAMIGGEIVIEAVVNGKISNPFGFRIKERMAQNLILLANGQQNLNIAYGQSINLYVMFLPSNIDDKSYNFEFVSGEEYLNIRESYELFSSDTMNNKIFTLKYNVPTTEPIIVKATKVVFVNGIETVLSSIVTIHAKTSPINNLFVWTGSDYISPNSSRQIKYSFNASELNQNCTDYIIDQKFSIVKGGEYATLIASDNISYAILKTNNISEILDNQLILRCEITTSTGTYVAEKSLYILVAVDTVIITPTRISDQNNNTLPLNYSNGYVYANASDQISFNISINPDCAVILEKQMATSELSYAYFFNEQLIIKNDPQMFSNSNTLYLTVYVIVSYYIYNEETGLKTYYIESNIITVIITKKPVESVNINDTIDVIRPQWKDSNGSISSYQSVLSFAQQNKTIELRLGDTFLLKHMVYPSYATYKNSVIFSVITNANYIQNLGNGIFKIAVNAPINCFIDIKISVDGVDDYITIKVLNAELNVFKAEFIDNSQVTAAGNSIYLPHNQYASGYGINITTYPSYYVLEHGLYYSQNNKNAYIANFTSYSYLYTYAPANESECLINLSITEPLYYLTYTVQIKLAYLKWNSIGNTVNRGSLVLINASYIGYNFGNEILYTTSSEYSTIIYLEGNYYLSVFSDAIGGMNIIVYAKLGNSYNISKQIQVLMIEGLEFVLPETNDIGYSDWTTEYYEGAYRKVYPMLHGGFLRNSAYGGSSTIDSLQILVNGKLNNGSLITLSLTPTFAYNSAIGTISNRVLTIKNYENYNVKDFLVVKVSCENIDQYLIIRPFYPAAPFSSPGTVAIVTQSTPTKEQIGYSYNFTKEYKPYYPLATNSIVEFAATNETNWSITKNGNWTAKSGVGGNFGFKIKPQISNSYLGRVFSSPFSKDSIEYTTPYYLHNAVSVNNIRNDPSGIYFMRQNISLSSYANWTPIPQFSGKIYGNDYEIYSLRIVTTAAGRYGLIATNDKNGYIEKLKIEAYISTHGCANNAPILIGSFAGLNWGTITDCTATGYRYGSYNSNTNSYSVDLYGASYESQVGGIAGSNTLGTISNCINYSSIATCRIGGGIVGDNAKTIQSCTNYANIRYWYLDRNGAVGGIAGFHSFESISSCINYGGIYYDNPSSESHDLCPRMGQLVGLFDSGMISYSAIACSGNVYSGSLKTVTYKTGVWPFQKTETHDQAKYVSNDIYGEG